MGNSDRSAPCPETALEQICDMCDGGPVTCEIESQEFLYGTGDDAVTLTANIGVWKCANCGFKFTDGDAEERRHESVCNYLGILAPSEIIALRERHGLSRAAFADLTDIGEASLKRWEYGLQIQSKSMDNFLRLLLTQDGFQLLESLKKGRLPGASQKFSGRFRTPISQSAINRSSAFQLRLEPA